MTPPPPQPPPPQCPYRVLGIPRTASPDEIKRAFLRLAKDSHPDRLPVSSTAAERSAAAARFAAAADAYSLIGDASRRAAFDRGAVGSSYAASASGSGSGYYRSQASAYNPYGGNFRASSHQRQQQRRPPSFLSNLFRLVAARSTRGDAWAHVALAAVALGGAAAAATAGDSLWREHNRGKLFEDLVAAGDERELRRRQQQKRQRQEQEEDEEDCASPAALATSAAAGAAAIETAAAAATLTAATDEP